ncbi:MAG: GNAT family N-acetyltransferase [Patescibacteria group bacterium]
MSESDCLMVREWRNDSIETLRTPYMLTEEMQRDFYKNTVCNRNANSRWWAINKDRLFIGMAGLTDIQWENGTAEISLIIHPKSRGMGYGFEAAEKILDKAFNELRLANIFGECYYCNPEGIKLWSKLCGKYQAFSVDLPCRKFFAGVFHNSYYFTILHSEYLLYRNTGEVK